MAARHWIRSFDFDLTFASDGMAMSQGEPLRALVVDQLLPVVASVFDEATDDGAAADIYRIDRLNVDLGEVYAEDLPETLAERLAQALADVLILRRDTGAADDGGAGEEGDGFGVGDGGDGGSVAGQMRLESDDASVWSQAAPTPHVSKFATATAADVADLIAFLASGQSAKPGVAPALAQAEREDTSHREERMRRDTDAVAADDIEGLLTRVLAGDIQAVRQQIRASASPDILIERLTKQFPADRVEALLRALRPAEASAWLRQLDSLDRLLTTVGWNATQRNAAQSAARARLLAIGLLPPHADLREMPWHGVWQSVLSIAQVRGLARDAFEFVAKVEDSVRADKDYASAIAVTQSGGRSQADLAFSPMIDALHRVADALAGEEVRAGGTTALHSEVVMGMAGERPDVAVSTANASPRPSPRPLTRAGLRVLLATALMRAQAKPLYGIWPTLVANEAGTLREALRRYLAVPDLREQIALTFPESMLEDMLTLLLAARANAVQASTRVRRNRADPYAVATNSPSTGHDINRTWGWRNAWSHDIAGLLDIDDSDEMSATGLRDEALRDAPVLDASFNMRAESDAAVLIGQENSTAAMSGDSVQDDPSDALIADESVPRSGGRYAPANERKPNNPSYALPSVRPSTNDADAHGGATTRQDTLIQALLSGSAVALHEDWAEWTGEERAVLAAVWRHYATYDTVLMRVVEGFPEAMLVDLATLTEPSASAVWEAFGGLSVSRLVDADQVSAYAIERLPGDTSRALDGPSSVADNGGHETHAQPITRNLPSKTEFDRWKREVWHAIFIQLRAISPVASTSSTSSISSMSFAALEAIALRRGTTAWTRRALDLWRASVTNATTATTTNTTSPGTIARSPRAASSIDVDDNDRRPLESSTAAAMPSASVPLPVSRHTAHVAIQRLSALRQRVNPQGGDLIARASSLPDAERVELRQIVTEISSLLDADLLGIDARHWQAVVDTMITVSETIPDAHREVLYRSILDNTPEVDDRRAEAAEATGRYYASVATALASDAVLDLDLFAASAIADVASSSPDDPDFNSPEPFPATSPNRPPAMPEDFITYLTSTDFRQGSTPPAGFDIWLRQSVYSGAHVLRPVIAMAAEDEVLAERWLDVIPQPLWPGIARLSSRDTPQVAQMLRVASDITDLFATTVETVAPASLHRARWRFLFPWLFLSQRPFDATPFATSLVAQLARHANVSVPPALASRVQQQTGIDMRTAEVTDDVHLLQTPLMVPYAGIVLAWPFTPQLWETLGLTKEHRFVSDEAAERAVLLLHHVGSGLTEAPEPHLTMHKLLCGLPLATPVARNLDITADESAICDRMLDVIIEHWSAIGNTSREGLRGSFLQREGRLSLAEDGWHLKVKRAPYDMLLDRLQWSISTIRLSWMEQTLWVEWA